MSRVIGPVAILLTIGFAFGLTPNAFATTSAPSITVTTPTSGQTTSAELNVTGRAWDKAGIKRVAIAVDSGTFSRTSGTTTWTGSVNTAAYPDGSHYLRVRAWDRLGHRRTMSVPVSFSNSTASGTGTSGSGSAGPQSMDTPEGTHIDVNTAGPWTADQVYQMLKENGLNSTIGPTLTVEVQDSSPSSVSSQSGTSASGQPTFRATMYLQGVNSTFSMIPDAAVGHEFGHVWTLYYLAMAKNGDWSSYLSARGLAGDPRLNSSYEWMPREIIADDYRLLFGSSSAISEDNRHLNSEIPDPRNVAGLKDFLAGSWTTPS